MAKVINYIGDVNPISHGGVVFLSDDSVLHIYGIVEDSGMVEIESSDLDDLVELYERSSVEVDSICGGTNKECPYEKAYNYIQAFGIQDYDKLVLTPGQTAKKLFGLLVSMKRSGFINNWRAE